MKRSHTLIAEVPFEVTALSKGYADRGLRVDLTRNEIRTFPVTQQMKDLWVGGKGFDLWLMFQEITGETRWDSPENPICMSPGPLAGTTSFPGSGKTLVTSLSPMTGSVMDCNVGGYFGPLLKFCGFDALVLIGKAPAETIVVIDAPRGRITIERAPLESIDAHLLAEELTEIYADDGLDKRNISIVCAGRGAQHTRMGVLNFSFYDWRKKGTRIKQAGRGGIGRVFRDKQMKAVVVRNRGINPAWSVAENKVAHLVTPKNVTDIRDAEGRAAIRGTIQKWSGDPERVIDMLREIQAHFGHLPRTALEQITRETCVPEAYLYHIATFLPGFSLEPWGAKTIQVCTGTTCSAMGASGILAACERVLGVRAGETTADRKTTLLDGGPCLGACHLAPLVRIGTEVYGRVTPEDVEALLAGRTPGGAQRLCGDDLAMVHDEGAAFEARSRALLAICTGRRTPGGSAAAAKDGSSTMITGLVAHPGAVAIAPGMTLAAAIEAAGGMRGGAKFQAAHAGGPSGVWLGPESLARPLDAATLKPTGTMTGPE
ncbi:MAG: aldehyde ferredoxin oxidoreductase N-terminal domain-containing protein, partial [Candidatus Eisenbacteria bacterium]